MTNKEIILKSVKFIESKLKSEIDVFSVSREVCYSLYHFIRLFQSITGYSPKNYIQKRRLTQAAIDIRDTDKKISDIAYDYQFGSPENFTRAFRKQFNCNPTEIRKGFSLANLTMVYPITSDYLFQSTKIKDCNPELVELKERVLVGISFFVNDGIEIKDLSKEWSQIIKEKHSIKNRINPERYHQLQFWSNEQDLGGMFFFTGIEVAEAHDVNPLFVVKTIPAGNYLRFTHYGFSNKVGNTYAYIYNKFLPDTDYCLSKPFNFEYYGEKFQGPYNQNSESDIYIPVD